MEFTIGSRVLLIYLMLAFQKGPVCDGVTGNKEQLLTAEKAHEWANLFGEQLLSISRNLTAYEYITGQYARFSYVDGDVHWDDILKEMAVELDRLLSRKVSAIEKLMTDAEELYVNHTFDENLDFDYYNNKRILRRDEVMEMARSSDEATREMAMKFQVIDLEPSEKYNGVPVNTSLSTVHVPTNVFDRSPPVMNGVYWTDGLNEDFKENGDSDQLAWQYYCSSDGFFRIYPGMKWPRNNQDGAIDLFDCRLESWYLQAATCPKNLVLLVDSSGSMKGLRQAIARSTVNHLLETLSDEDYFNIMRFSKTVDYIDPCFNGSMMVASAQNKRRLKEIMNEDVTAQDTANFRGAFQEAFRLLEHEKAVRNNHSLCNKAILLITDGVPENYEDIFEKYNWPNKTVRVFTYLIGREISDDRQVKWLACANKGFYSHISTLADVKENIQNYIKVLSRPMAIQRVHNVIWTSVYLDHISTLNIDEGLKLITSAAIPVFDLKNETSLEGNLLGVMGTDVSIKEIQKTVPSYKLGVLSYTFLINHNGYVLFHPNFKPFRRKTEDNELLQHPNYNSMDLMDVVMATNRKILMEMRENILSSVSGSKTLNLLVHYDKMKRMSSRNYSFFYHKVGTTNFHIGIAVPDISKNQVKSATAIPSLIQCLNGTNMEIALWEYCKGLGTKLRGRARIDKVIDMFPDTLSQLAKNCDKDLVHNLIHDGKMTGDIMQKWISMGNDFQTNIKDNCSSASQPIQVPKAFKEFVASKGVELVFIGTKAGLTRYLKVQEHLTDVKFLEDNLNTVESRYYQRAVEGVEELNGQPAYQFSYFVPMSENFDINTTMVTASAPIVVHRDGKMGVGAVVGMQMKYQKFADLFFTETSTCLRPPCIDTCANDTLSCYLVDRNGYVVASKIPYHVSKFFGEVEPSVMTDLVMTHKIFKGYVHTDYQAVCEIRRYEKEKSSAAYITNPLKAVWNGMIWLFMETTLFLTEFSWTSFWSSSVEGNPATGCIEYYEDYDIGSMTSQEQEILKNNFKRHCTQEMERNQTIGYRACHKSFTLYDWNIKQLLRGTLQAAITQNCFRCDAWSTSCYTEEEPCPPMCIQEQACHKTYTVSWVNNTNMLMIVVANNCECVDMMPFNLQHEEQVDTSLTQEEQCNKLHDTMYRHPRGTCQDYSEDEDDKKCGQGRVYLSLGVLIMSLLVSSLMPTEL